MTPRTIAAAVAAGLVAAGLVVPVLASSPPPEAADRGATTGADTAVAPDGSAAGAADAAGAAGAESTCRRELAEMDRRDEAGTIDWEAIEGPESDDEPTEQELESVVIDREPLPGDVLAAGERPSFPDFSDRLDVARLSDVELIEAVDICYEVGLLVDGDDDGEEGDDQDD